MHGTSEVQDSSTFAGYRRQSAGAGGSLLVLVLVPLTAVLFSLRQERVYEASAEVLLARRTLPQRSRASRGPAQPAGDPDRHDAGRLARVPIRWSRPPCARHASAGAASATFSMRPTSRRRSTRICSTSGLGTRIQRSQQLATEYARQFTRYRQTLDAHHRGHPGRDRDPDRGAGGRRGSRSRRCTAPCSGQGAAAAHARGAPDLERLPRPRRRGRRPGAAEAGAERDPRAALGLVLGIGLAFLWEALDTRVRSADDIAARLGSAFLARLPEPPKKLQKDDRLVMLAQPTRHARGGVPDAAHEPRLRRLERQAQIDRSRARSSRRASRRRSRTSPWRWRAPGRR